MLGEPVARDEILLGEHADQRREQPRVGARLHLEMDVGDLGGLGAARVDHDQAARRILRDLAQRRARARDAVREPRVLAQEQRHLAVLEVGARVAADHLARRPRTRRSSPARARSSGGSSRAPRACCARRRRADGCPARRRRSRRSTRRRTRRAPRRSAPPPRGSRCPSRSPRSCRRGAGAAAWSAGAGRSGSSRAATASRRHSRARTGCASSPRTCTRRRPSSPPSCTSIPQLHSHRMQAVDFQSDIGSPGSGARFAKDHQLSPNGRRSSSNVHAERSWCTTWCTASAMPLGWMKKSSGRSGNALRVHGTSITASVTM